MDNQVRKTKRRSIKGRIMGSTAVAVLILVLVSAAIMAWSMMSLTRTILLDTLQPMARETAKTVEANLRLLADRTMGIAGDRRLTDSNSLEEDKISVLIEAREQYELYTVGLYSLEGKLLMGEGQPAASIASDELFALLRQTENLTIGDPIEEQGQLGIAIGMPVKQDGITTAYFVGRYKYDVLNDVISSISVGKSGMAIILNQEGAIVGHPDPEVVKQGNNIYELGNSTTASSIFDRMISGETGSAVGIVNGERAFVAFSPIRGTRWSLAIEVPSADYMYMAYYAILQIFSIALLMLILAMWIVYRLSKKISVSLNMTTERITRLAEGDLRSEVVVTNSRDELETLSNSLKITVNCVNAYLSEIKEVLAHLAQGNLNIEVGDNFQGDFIVVRHSLTNIIASLNRTMHQISEATVRLSGTADTLNGHSETLHQASVEQNRAMRMLVDEVEAVKQNLEVVSGNAAETKNQVAQISAKIADGTAQMQQLLEAMSAISGNANEISKVSKVIEDISFQTNILALNASVEAARAGAAGKGFAVVAEEVRTLAGRSAEAAKSTTQMIDGSYAMIQTGAVLTNTTAESLAEIAGLSSEISEITDHLTQAVDTQRQSLSEITEKVNDISGVTDLNMQTARDTATVSGELSQEADHLKHMIGQFLLREAIK